MRKIFKHYLLNSEEFMKIEKNYQEMKEIIKNMDIEIRKLKFPPKFKLGDKIKAYGIDNLECEGIIIGWEWHNESSICESFRNGWLYEILLNNYERFKTKHLILKENGEL